MEGKGKVKASERDVELLTGMYENMTADLDKLLAMKHLIVKSQQYELAASVRQIELDYFPMTEEEEQAVERGRDLELMFGMAKIKVDAETAWQMEQMLLAFRKKRGRFSVKDAAEIHAKGKRLFQRAHNVTRKAS